MNSKFFLIRLILLIYLCLTSFDNIAQTSILQKEINGVRVLAKAKDDGIHLRWAPSDAIIWELGNKLGYKVFRYTIMENGQITQDKEFVDLTPQAIKPRPEMDWENIIEEPYAPVAAQALFGETFQVSQGGVGLMDAYNKSKEQEARFGLSLMAADLSPITAEYSGLYFKDASVERNKKYLYKIFIPSERKALDTAAAYLAADELSSLPRIKSLKADFGNKSVKLEWNTSYGFGHYTAYHVERSVNDEAFERVNERPLVSADFDPNKAVNLLYFQDSLKDNKTTYRYRIIGVSPFGDEGPTSNEVVGKGKVLLSVKPYEVSHEYDSVGNIKLKWKFDEGFEYALKGFHVIRVENLDDGKVVKLNDTPIAPDSRSFTDTKPKISNYYQVIAESQYDEMRASITHLAKTVDSIPPTPTTILNVEVDTSGMSTIKWKANRESDFYGYKVMKAYNPEAEFSLVNGDILTDTVFTDSLQLKRLNRNVYYKVVSLDRHYNHSKASKVVKGIMPDIVPPVAPTLNKVVQDSLGIRLEWNNSSSKDFRNSLIYRKEGNAENWKLIQVFTDNTRSSWHDTDLSNNTRYTYTMIAVDSAGNESEAVKAIPVHYRNFDLKKGIDFFNLEVDREEKWVKLEWEIPSDTEIKSVEVYRGDENTPLRHKFKVDASQNEYFDKQLQINTDYKYALRVTYSDGSVSKISKVQKIKY